MCLPEIEYFCSSIYIIQNSWLHEDLNGVPLKSGFVSSRKSGIVSVDFTSQVDKSYLCVPTYLGVYLRVHKYALA